MKKFLLLTMMATAFFCSTVSAQGGGMSPEQRAERQKQTKTELVAQTKITEAEADKVMQIQQDSRQALRGMRDMTPEERQKKMEEVKAENTKKFKTIPLTDEQVKAVDAYYDEQMKRMMNRGGGNGNK